MMGDMVFDAEEIKEFQRTLRELGVDIHPFFQDCTNVLSGELYKRAVKKTPIRKDSYPRSRTANTKPRSPSTTREGETKERAKRGSREGLQSKGTLRRGWERKKETESGKYKIIIRNNVAYADYVENGHRVRKREGYGWVEPRHMMKDAQKEVEEIAPQVVQSRLNRLMHRNI